MKIREFIDEIDKLYPVSTAAPWDRDGLQCCVDPEIELRRVLVALDATEEVVDYAANGGFDLILTHHPMIFGDVGDVVPSELYGRKLIKLITSGVGTASFHTRLDAGKSGVNDILAELLGLSDIVPFGDDDHPSIGRIGMLGTNITSDELSLIVKEKLGAPFIRATGCGTVQKIAVLGGAGKSCIPAAIKAGADAIVTGEVSYNAALDFADMGIIVIEAGHYYTEFPVCSRLAQMVRDISGAEVEIFDTTPQINY